MSEEVVPVWIAIRSRHRGSDISHRVFAFANEADASLFSKTSKERGDMIDVRKFNAGKGMTNFYVVFHFHDNYADVVKVFRSPETANTYYSERIAEMEDELKDGMHLENAFVGSAENGEVQRQRMRTMYDEDGYYPDKGSRWVMTVVSIPAVGGRRLKRLRSQKTKRHSSKLMRKTKKHKRRA